VRYLGSTLKITHTEDISKQVAEDHHNLYCLLGIFTVIGANMMRQAGHLAFTREMRNAYTVFVRKPRVKRSLGIRGRRSEGNMHLTQDVRVYTKAGCVETATNLWIPQK
jgi:hypothetical protein